MIRPTLSILLAGFFLLSPAMGARAARAQAADAESRTAAIRQKVEAAGAGSEVEVRLLDHNKIRGRLVSVGSEDFVVRSGDEKAPVLQTVRFEDVESFRGQGPTPPTEAGRNRSQIGRRGKLMLAVGIAVLVFGVVTYATTQ